MRGFLAVVYHRRPPSGWPAEHLGLSVWVRREPNIADGASHRVGYVAVGIRIAPYPPHRSGQADFPAGGPPIA